MQFCSCRPTHVALDAARSVVGRSAVYDVLPEARAGLDYVDDFSKMISSENPVNVAARIVGVAKPSAVFVSKAFATSLDGGASDFRPLGSFELKVLGRSSCSRRDLPEAACNRARDATRVEAKLPQVATQRVTESDEKQLRCFGAGLSSIDSRPAILV